MTLKLIILGSGTSHGIPMIGCDCAVCTSDDPRDKRTRCSAALVYDGRTVLIDASPELRLQCLACGIRHVDAVLFTHAHADHVAGIDDLRIFSQRSGRALPVYASRATLDRLQRAYAYAFEDDPDYPSAKPQLEPHVVDGPFELFGRTIVPVEYDHGPARVTGYRLGPVAYCPDCSHLPEASRRKLAGLDVLVLDALRRRPHPTHFNLEQAIAEARRIGARQTYFTHIAHELGHAETSAGLPAGMALACDGLVIEPGRQ